MINAKCRLALRPVRQPAIDTLCIELYPEKRLEGGVRRKSRRLKPSPVLAFGIGEGVQELGRL